MPMCSRLTGLQAARTSMVIAAAAVAAATCVSMLTAAAEVSDQQAAISSQAKAQRQPLTADRSSPEDSGPSSDLSVQVNEAFHILAGQIMTIQIDPTLDSPFAAAIAIDGEVHTLNMIPHSVRSSNYRLRAQIDDETYIDVEPGPLRTLRGNLTEVPGSMAAGSLLEDGLHAVIRLPDGDRVWVEPIASKVKGAAADQYVVYHNSDVIPSNGTCGVEDIGPPKGLPELPEDGVIAGANIFCTEMACDADFEYFTDHGSSVSNVETQINLIINTVNLQYESECDIRHVITEIIVRTTAADPYTATAPSALLCEFRNHWNSNHDSIQRDVAHLFTGKNLDGTVIGIAYNGVICNAVGFTCGTNDNSGYSLVESDCCLGGLPCKTDLSAHELGHNWDASHCSCPNFTMNPSLECANTFTASSITEIVAHRNSRTCLDTCEDGTITLPFFDDFPTTTIDPVKWTGIDGALSNTQGTAEPSAPNSANLDGSAQGGDELRTAMMNTTNLSVLRLDYFYQQGGGGNDPDLNEDLVIEYVASDGDWTEVNRHLGSGAAMTTYSPVTIDLPADAMHSEFRLRFRAISLNVDSDDWFVDNVAITGFLPPSNNTCISAPITLVGSHPFTTIGATTDGPNEPAGCNFNGNSQITNDVWFLFGAQCTGTATVSLCGANYNSKLAVYGAACPGGSGQTLACNDAFCGDDAQVSFPVVTNQAYRIRVGGFNGAIGTGTMVISCIPSAQPCPADINASGAVNVDDLVAVINNWGAVGNNPADVNDDNVVDVDDLVEVINAWGACP